MSTRTRYQRQPSRGTCSECGEPVSLIDCGVRAHRTGRTPRERLEGRCTGRVYGHDLTGAMDCGMPDAWRAALELERSR